jgi:hypothetical protein
VALVFWLVALGVLRLVRAWVKLPKVAMSAIFLNLPRLVAPVDTLVANSLAAQAAVLLAWVVLKVLVLVILVLDLAALAWKVLVLV